MISDKSGILEMRNNYLSGNFGYGDSKKALYELCLSHFENERKKFNYFNENPEEVSIALVKGASKARLIANEILLKVRDKIGY